MRGIVLMAALMAGAAAPLPAQALRLPAAEVPLPSARPDPADVTGAIVPDPPTLGMTPDPKALRRAADPVARGLDALDQTEIEALRAIRDALPAGSLDRAILTFALASGGFSAVGADELAAALTELDGWPGLDGIERNRERALARLPAEPEAVIQAFAGRPPLTLEGKLMLARAHRSVGDGAAAAAVLAPVWRMQRLDGATEVRLIAEFGEILSREDHRVRMETMLHDERAQSALRVAGLAGAEALARAWTAVNRGDRTAAALLDAVPEEQRTSAYIFAKARFLRRGGRFLEAAETMLSVRRDAQDVVDPDAWWVERRVLSREMLDIGRPDLAYAIAAAHSAESPAMAADAEFHAGWYALSFLDQPETALAHFERIAALTSGAISQSRAFYWMARAMEAGAPGDAGAAYEKAAAFGTAFYGQIAAAKLGRQTIPVAAPQPSPHERLAFARRPEVAAIRRLEEAGHAGRAEALYRGLAATLENPREIALLSAMAERRGDHTLALRVGKIAAARGLDVGALAHPLGAIPPEAEISDAGAALAYAIARQESEFNAGAVSGAGARGLLQLLPGTARDMARGAGLPYSPARLTTDAAYNATLGAAFLADQLGRFDGSYVLTFAGYNAGPGRARDWVERYGDPRGADLAAVVDWIERIPFTETRNYVQRVMENYQVYKMRLTGRTDVARDLVAGR
ncbi:lytic transglycosylase domain-containing protein [Aquibium microcysteis]|uniref:lytic transglycosylase domain-containing protein n=1 Tax=Aquibium microcysteis TaxID=675281 RepID=UPI00165CF534|nr:lytic transglycosylase domain-containing protein [Aquibium microcysteis]